MKKRVLITGVNGFIGREFVKYTKHSKKNTHVYCTDIHQQNNYPHFTSVNLLKKKQVIDLLQRVRPHYIFHLAGGRMADEEKLKQSNIETTDVLMKTIIETDLLSAKVVVPGSAAEYGLPDNRIRKMNERHKAKPLSMYGKVKLRQTQLALNYAKKGINVAVGRIFNITGSNTPDQLAAGRFAKQIVELERKGRKGIIKTMDLSGRRDFLDITDVCSGLWKITELGRSGQIYNVCSAQSVSIEDLLFQLIQKSRLIDVEIDDQLIQKFKSFNVIGSNAKIKRETRWQPKVSLEESLANTLKSYRTIRK